MDYFVNFDNELLNIFIQNRKKFIDMLFYL
jgi:hypothetical protein